MSQPTPDVIRDTDDPNALVIEAPTAEGALEEVTRRLGPDAQILGATKVARGGVAGFFARELVQLRARPAGAEPLSVRPPDLGLGDPSGVDLRAPGTTPEAAPRAGGVDDLLADLAVATSQEERSFGDVLRERMPELATAGSAPGGAHSSPPRASGAARPMTPAPPDPPTGSVAPSLGAPSPAPASAPPAPGSPQPVAWPSVAAPPPGGSSDVRAPGAPDLGEDATGPSWSTRRLVQLGLPTALIAAVDGAGPRDDTAWTSAVARALEPLCRPLPAGSAVYVGPRARAVAALHEIPVVAVGATAPESGSFAVAARGSQRARSWLAWSAGRRWLHLVVGGEGWRGLLAEEPLAVSWATPSDLCDAVRVATELGLVLGGGPLPGRTRSGQRATPVDLAVAIRDQVLAR